MLRDMIKRHEGYHGKPYVCGGGHSTIGWGHNMDDEPLPPHMREYLDAHGQITEAMAEELLTKDIKDATDDCTVLYPDFNQFSPSRKNALIDFLFNVGIKTAMTFKATNLAINEERWNDAANQILKSKYARQVGARAKEVASLLRDGAVITSLRAEKIGEKNGRGVWRLLAPLAYKDIIVPAGFITDFASVPRLPFAYWLCGDHAHSAATVHDFLYCKDATPNVTRKCADDVFLAIMEAANEALWRRKTMYWIVRLFAGSSFHKRSVKDPP